ncbi:hypothetical protein JTE90_021066 [Oedothorax gibbosus]|uniref:Uncharacterized protein n=1 Tax=Oedothorax gibbosus TaxID=931172 RepID=A0AAV6VQZ1_9ARAC|nr:hypothetical protein JTE90_021066 [Oedothorax gibbosus]
MYSFSTKNTFSAARFLPVDPSDAEWGSSTTAVEATEGAVKDNSWQTSRQFAPYLLEEERPLEKLGEKRCQQHNTGCLTTRKRQRQFGVGGLLEMRWAGRIWFF